MKPGGINPFLVAQPTLWAPWVGQGIASYFVSLNDGVSLSIRVMGGSIRTYLPFFGVTKKLTMQDFKG